ncbi:MAG: hypothetical protein IMW98_01440 [Firmicutes bacterium]|nr:hypothetical protein [Bacillota bacterium]
MKRWIAILVFALTLMSPALALAQRAGDVALSNRGNVQAAIDRSSTGQPSKFTTDGVLTPGGRH